MIGKFSVIFVSILLEAMPFVLIGSLVSSFIHVYISEAMIVRMVPKKKWLGYLIASMMGLIFPVCECAIVPIMRRLIKKGVPSGLAITFMLAVPIMNPVVLFSTYVAFSGQWKFVLLRGGVGVFAAIIIGVLFDRILRGNQPLKEESNQPSGVVMAIQTECPSSQMQSPTRMKKNMQSLAHLLRHTVDEFFDVGRYLMLGAFISTLLQVFVPRGPMLALGGTTSAIVVLMLFAFVISLCSEADAFIARTFLGQFSHASIIAFLIFGPMIDIKNTLMLAGVMKRRYVVRLIPLIAVVCGVLSYMLWMMGV